MKNLALALLPSLLSATLSSAAPKPQNSLCHFDEDEATWVLIPISANAMTAHLIHHDDGVPGSATVVTGTQLDANCQAPAPANADASSEPEL